MTLGVSQCSRECLPTYTIVADPWVLGPAEKFVSQSLLMIRLAYKIKRKVSMEHLRNPSLPLCPSSFLINWEADVIAEAKQLSWDHGGKIKRITGTLAGKFLSHQ